MLPFSLSGFEIQQIAHEGTSLTITAHTTSTTAVCPTCQHISHRVHSYYTRSPHDLPVSGQTVQLILSVRRFRCQNRQCARQTFAERLPELPLSARQTARLGAILESIAVVLSGQAGSRLAEQLSMPVSADALLRRAKKARSTSPLTPRYVGVDDFAFRRGRTYGTILVDLETHHPIDLLEDRSSETLAAWLRLHPGIEIISRDRSTEYLRGATEGAPQAQQVLDRWHVVKNLREAVERFLNRIQKQQHAHPNTHQEVFPRQKRTKGEQERSEGSRRRRLALYHQVIDLHKQGGSILGIARQLNISRQTVRKFVQAPDFPEFQRVPRTKSAIDAFRPYLSKRWQEGCHQSKQLWQELQERGFTGSHMMVYRWVQLQKDAGAQPLDPIHTPARAPVKDMAPRHLAWVFLRDVKRLEKQELQALAHIRQEEHADMVYRFTQQFVAMVKERNARPLDTWLEACQMSGISELATFAQGLNKEVSALRAALTLPYSNGPVEGKINKLKYIKRSMYGRGGFPLLRQRVLKSA
ncbi:ISL3 family transposase [Dictyobacter kobayashii]|uniref:ISL3 family transposase n=1 Tax=Dictyobacter kobayashii TaxID=2014872 RepID=A0A402AF01_9CHLR|nr:ISL3 family transposase [Dictyobacter kobayashii]GCE17675.1 ISL3 family transposase [Dictyobacter kobayashii]